MNMQVDNNLSRYFISAIFIILFISCGSDNINQSGDNDPDQEEEVLDISLPKALFTEPGKIENQLPSTIIMDQLISLVNATPRGASLYMSIYHFEYPELVKALKDAHNSGVAVHVLIDASDRSKGNIDTIQKLKNFGEDVDVIGITNDASKTAINHNKSVIFSKIETESGEVNKVIFSSSHNFTKSGIKKIQDAVILQHKGLYNDFLDYWEDMKSLSSSGMVNYNYRSYNDPESEITAYFHPKRKNGRYYDGDTIVEILNNITDPSSATIKIGMSVWYGSRPKILPAINKLIDQGADFEIITKSSNNNEVLNELRNIANKGAMVKIYNMDSSSPIPKINIHSKYMLIEGEWKGDQRKVLVNGTQNFGKNALRNNGETTLLLLDHPLFDAYEEYFEEIEGLPGICCQQRDHKF